MQYDAHDIKAKDTTGHAAREIPTAGLATHLNVDAQHEPAFVLGPNLLACDLHPRTRAAAQIQHLTPWTAGGRQGDIRARGGASHAIAEVDREGIS